MLKTAAYKMAWVVRTASVVFLLAAVLAGCAGETAGPGTQQEGKAASPEAKDDRATTSEGRRVMIEMVANDTGESLEVDGFEPGRPNGDIICETATESGRIESCAYTPSNGFTGTDKFEYTVKDANGKTDTAMVYVRVKPAS
jgi:Bacterial Ig domain